MRACMDIYVMVELIFPERKSERKKERKEEKKKEMIGDTDVFGQQ